MNSQEELKTNLLRYANSGKNCFLKTLISDLNEVLNMTSYEDTLVWLWQQNSNDCYNALKNTEHMEYFKSLFKDSDKSQIYYRGINGVDETQLSESRSIISASTDKGVAKNFATLGSNSILISETQKGVILTLVADKVLDLVKEGFGVVDNESEVLLMNWEIKSVSHISE